MKCPIETRENADWLLAYSSRSLDVERATLLKEHIGQCPSCREFARSHGAVWEALDSWEAPPVSADFDRRLYQRVEQEVSWWDLLMRPFRPLMFRRGLPVAATAGLLLAAGLLFQHPGGVPRSNTPESAHIEAMPPEQVEHALDEMETMREFNRLVRPESAEPRM